MTAQVEFKIVKFEVAEEGSEGPWIGTKVPTTIHQDLMKGGKIPDPFLGLNEREVQWVHVKNWVYRASFETTGHMRTLNVDLVFEGLDTFAAVSLNGTNILESNNMFLSHRKSIKHLLRPESERNDLKILFSSALARGNEIMAEKGKLICWNGHYCRTYIRKAQYHFGWDWGPSLVTCGPWKPIYLQCFEARIGEWDLETFVSSDLKTAKVRILIPPWTQTTEGRIRCTIFSPKGVQLFSKDYMTDPAKRIQVLAGVHDPELWFPRNLGSQPMYSITLQLFHVQTGQLLDDAHKVFGIRCVQLIQDPLSEAEGGGTTFYFKINNCPTFAGGANWVPGDSFLPRMEDENYLNWVEMAAERGNMNMLRVWGGGVYESDAFYDACDKLGIMVWQDVCFACGQYPGGDDSFADSVLAELKENVIRIKRHPSLIIVAGNNEDYQMAEEELNYDKEAPKESWKSSNFPARDLYEEKFPALMSEIAATVVYWPGSPWRGEKGLSSVDRTCGDIHQWNICGGILAPYQRYPDLGGRFVSEFGMCSMPVLQTVEQSYLANSSAQDRHPQSEVVEHHMKAHTYERRVNSSLAENVRLDFKLENYIYLTQVIQSEGMYYAYRGWRRQWGPVRECGGALCWQLNDCWPVTSWSLVDSHQRPKPAFYAVARALSPITVGIKRLTNDPKPNSKVEGLVSDKRGSGSLVPMHSTPHLYPPKVSTCQVWIANGTLEPLAAATLDIRFIRLGSGEVVSHQLKSIATVAPNTTTEVYDGIECPEDEPTVVHITLSVKESIVARDTDWPQPLKYSVMATAYTKDDIDIKISKFNDIGEASAVSITATKPVKALTFEERDGWCLEDNCIDIVPGDDRVISVKRFENSYSTPKETFSLAWKHLGMM